VQFTAGLAQLLATKFQIFKKNMPVIIYFAPPPPRINMDARVCFLL